jgi:TolB-like protein
MSASAPTASEVRETLARIAASDDFRASPNLTAFLKFIVERTLEGREDTIKAYTVATEVLGRPESFDPQVDPIVRVEATRLRRSLERYYGRHADGVTISIPRGSYVPHFGREPLAPAPDAAVAPLPASRPSAPAARPGSAATRTRTSRMVFVAGAAVAMLLVAVMADVMMGGFLGRIWGDRTRAPAGSPTLAALTTDPGLAPARTRPALSLTTFGTVLVAPVVESNPSGRTHAAIVTDLLRDGLARFEDIAVVEVASDQASSLPAASDDTYLLSGKLVRQGASSKVTLRLRHEASQQIVWSGEFNLAVGDGAGITETTFIRRVAAAIASPAGVIAADPGSAKRRADPMVVPATCLIETEHWLDTSDLERLAPIEACLERTMTDYPRFAAGWSLGARVALERYRTTAGGRDVLDTALARAQTAASLARQSARAQAVLSDVMAARGDLVGAQAAAQRALDLNPHCPTVLQANAFRSIEAGDYKTGLALLDEVAAAGVLADPWRSLYRNVALAFTDPAGRRRHAPAEETTAHPASRLAASIKLLAEPVPPDASRAALEKGTRDALPGVAEPSAFLSRLGFSEAVALSVDEKLKAAATVPPRG